MIERIGTHGGHVNRLDKVDRTFMTPIQQPVLLQVE